MGTTPRDRPRRGTLPHHARQRLGAALLLALSLGACRSPLSGAEIEAAMQQTMAAARAHHEAGRDVEAALLLQTMTRVDRDYPGLAELDDQVPTLEESVDPGALGMNVRPRQRIDSNAFARVLWYLPDRVLDLLDIVSFDVHVGPGALVNVHLTRAVQAGIGYRMVAGVGWHDPRSLGVRTQREAGFNILAAGAQVISAQQAGTSGAHGGTWKLTGLHGPHDRLYQDARDYWAVGAQVTAVVAGVDVDLHPIELYDAVVGFLLFDPLRDDLATTEGLELDPKLDRFLRKLERAAIEEESLENYREFKRPSPPR